MLFKKNRKKPDYRGLSVREIPDTLDPKTIYIAGDKGHKWVAVFVCPCGCRQTIQLNLLHDADHVWNTTIHRDASITIRPSVWRITGCRSHFIIVKGQLKWVTWDYF